MTDEQTTTPIEEPVVDTPTEEQPPIASRIDNALTKLGKEKPAWFDAVIEKPEAAEAYYAELRAEISRGEAKQRDEISKNGLGAGLDKAPESAVDPYTSWIESAGLDMDELGKYAAEHGDLSDEHYNALHKAKNGSMSLDDVKLVAKAQIDRGLLEAERQTLANDRMTRVQEQVFDDAGGADAWQDIKSWAASSLPAGARKLYHDRLSDPQTARAAARELIDGYKAANSGGSITPAQPAVTTSPKPTNAKELDALLEAAKNGDAQAGKTLQGIEQSEIMRLMRIKE